MGNQSQVDLDVNCTELNKLFLTSVPQASIRPIALQAEDSSSRLEDGFDFSGVTPEDVVESLISLKSNAIGFDKVNPTFFKAILPHILPFVTHIINTIFTTSIFPAQ